jgi:DNA anti-recombination protein RmuC
MTMEGQTEDKQAQEEKRFGDTFEQFGEQMAAWGEEFGRQMEAWGREFEGRMEAWGKEFGPRMEVWAEELAKHVEQLGKRVGRWFEEEVGSSASADSLREERLSILRLVEEGKISAAEAESLLRALGK